MRRYRIIGLVLVLFLCICVMIISLSVIRQEKEEGYYKYKIHQNNGEKYIEITGLTALGNQKKVLVIPRKINGIKVKSLESNSLFNFVVSTGVRWKSQNLEKVFFHTNSVYIYYNTFRECPNLKKIITINYELTGGDALRKAAIGSLYVPIAVFDTDEYIHEKLKPANITYYYNYETTNDKVWYWIDDVEYGEKIEFIPLPVREGYEFGGWYKEAECINKWDFETDTLPEEQFDEVEVEATPYEEAYTEMRQVYQETKLYAKWI